MISVHQTWVTWHLLSHVVPHLRLTQNHFCQQQHVWQVSAGSLLFPLTNRITMVILLLLFYRQRRCDYCSPALSKTFMCSYIIQTFHIFIISCLPLVHSVIMTSYRGIAALFSCQYLVRDSPPYTTTSSRERSLTETTSIKTRSSHWFYTKLAQKVIMKMNHIINRSSYNSLVCYNFYV